jgi:hypothetical protein
MPLSRFAENATLWQTDVLQAAAACNSWSKSLKQKYQATGLPGPESSTALLAFQKITSYCIDAFV